MTIRVTSSQTTPPNKPPFFAHDNPDIQGYIAQLQASTPNPDTIIKPPQSLFSALLPSTRWKQLFYEQKLSESRLIHEGIVLPGEIVWHEVKTYPENYRYRGHGGHTDFPLDDCEITRLLFRYTFTPPHKKLITGYYSNQLHLYYFGDRADLRQRYPTRVSVDYAAMYAELTGSPVFVLYMDDQHFQLI